MIEHIAGNKAVITFIDFVAAFDSISHRFLDEALEGQRPPTSQEQSSERYTRARQQSSGFHYREAEKRPIPTHSRSIEG